jgi:succinate dehydrogenase / fumarate reductase cytochrome b subunit
MSWLSRFLRSTIGQKLVMALSGLALVGFVIAHMVGNLQIFLGPDALNSYAALLQGNQGLLWVARLGLLGAIGAHIWSAFKLTLSAKSARPVSYKKRSWFEERYAVRTMRVGGVILLVFIVYHLLHFTIGAAHSSIQPCAVINDVFTCFAYENVVGGFKGPVGIGIGIFYCVAQIFLGLHLTHGVWSMSRTLGQGNPRFDGPARNIAAAIGLIITVGNCSIPIAVMAGFVS